MENPAAFNANTALDIDPRSYEVFEVQGKRLLFDRATESTLELNDLAFDALQLLQETDVDQAFSQLVDRHPGISLEEVVGVLAEMKRNGMFHFQPLDRSEQDAYLESLWNHHPRRIQMLMAQGCNLGCRYCYAWRNGSNQKHTLMPWNVARQAVDYLVWRSGNRPELQITFFGGEPLLNYPVIKQVVGYCRDIEPLGNKKFIFELCTNCTLMDKDVVDFLVTQKFLLFMSIDGWREMHNCNRPAIEKDDLYEVIVANAKYANEQYRLNDLRAPKVRANLTNRYNDRRGVADYLLGLGFTNVAVGSIEPLPHADPSPAALTEEQADGLLVEHETTIVEAIDRLKSGKEVAGYMASQLEEIVDPPQRLPAVGVTCGVGRNTLAVDNKGNLFPCHRFEGMEAFLLGNVFTGLDRKKTMHYYRKVNGHATENCHDCWIRDYCGGGCVWLLSTRQGHIADPTPQECDRRRRGMQLALWARTEMRAHFPGRFKSRRELPIDPLSGADARIDPPPRNIRLRVLANPPHLVEKNMCCGG